LLQLAQNKAQWRDCVKTSEASGSITRWTYLDQLLQYWLLTYDIRHHVLNYLILPEKKFEAVADKTELLPLN